jgi:hypothetical protein
MSDKEVFKAYHDVLDSIEKELTDLESDNYDVINMYKTLYSGLETLAYAFKSLPRKDSKEANAGVITEESLETLAIIASEFDKSDDELLRKQAAVFDEILLGFGASKRQVAEMKAAHDKEINRLKSQAADEKDPYTVARVEQDKENKKTEVEKAYKDKVKEFRPMEASLMTRSCPDHPGAQMSRIAEHTFQCSLDKGIYNFQTGYTTLKGNKVPGGDVSEQTQSFDRTNEITSFDTRESRLNQV